METVEIGSLVLAITELLKNSLGIKGYWNVVIAIALGAMFGMLLIPEDLFVGLVHGLKVGIGVAGAYMVIDKKVLKN